MTELDLTNPRVIEPLLNREGIKPSRSSGQNFLICAEPLEAAAGLAAEGPVNITELGAGYGPLTLSLLKTGRRVRAIEQDAKLARLLSKNISEEFKKNFELQPEDMRQADWTWPEPYQIFGNIPYNLSGLILRRLSRLEPAPYQAILMVQREVAERLTAGPGQLSLIGLATRLWGSADIVARVPASCFWPQPQVSSALVMLKPDPGRASVPEREAVLGLARVAFQTKRKQLGGSLTRYKGLTREKAAAALAKIAASPSQRPQELAPKQWQDLYRQVNSVL